MTQKDPSKNSPAVAYLLSVRILAASVLERAYRFGAICWLFAERTLLLTPTHSYEMRRNLFYSELELVERQDNCECARNRYAATTSRELET